MISSLFCRMVFLLLLFSYTSAFTASQHATRMHLRMIAVSSLEEANKIVAGLQAGQTFPALAQAYSQHLSQRRGGDLGLVSLEDLAPTIRDTLQGLHEGDVSPVIHLGEQYLLLQVTTDRFFQSGHRLYKAGEYESALQDFAKI